MSTKNIHNLIRGLSTKPGAFTSLDYKIAKVLNSNLTHDTTLDKGPGDIISVTKEGIVINKLSVANRSNLYEMRGEWISFNNKSLSKVLIKIPSFVIEIISPGSLSSCILC